MNGTSRNVNGVDFRLALEILSNRAADTHSHSENDCCGQSHSHSPTASTPISGQVIDLQEGTINPSNEIKENAQEEELHQRRIALEHERAKTREALHEELQRMTTQELLRTVLEAQQQRVATYKSFDSGLDAVLTSRNITHYPTLCADVTASFSVLSDTINTVQTVLDQDRHRTDLKALVGQLQGHEQVKLNLTAASHLERIRLQSLPEGDEQTKALFLEGIRSLRSKIDQCVEQINEILEVIQCAIVDDDDGEGM